MFKNRGVLAFSNQSNIPTFSAHVAHSFEHYGEGSFDQSMMRRPIYYLNALRHLGPFTLQNTPAHPNAIADFVTALVDVIQVEQFRQTQLLSLDFGGMLNPLQILGFAKTLEAFKNAEGDFILKIQTRCTPNPCALLLDPEVMQFPQLKNPVIWISGEVIFKFKEDRDNDTWLGNIKDKLTTNWVTRYADFSDHTRSVLSAGRDFTDVCVATDLPPLFIKVDGLNVKGKRLKIPIEGRVEEIALIPRSAKMHAAPVIIWLKGKISWVYPGEILLTRDF